MKKHVQAILFFLAAHLTLSAQTVKSPEPDTTRRLAPVTVHGYLSQRPAIIIPASVSVLGTPQLRLQPDNSFVTALNTLPGLRAEERSPGSYRLSIRGSLLRSPFGIRDVKIYFDDIPLTDAGGNTYLNAIDIANIRHIEILKGPDGSLFGANSGGVVLLNTVNRADSSFLNAGMNGGSYGLFHQKVSLQKVAGNNRFSFNQSYQNYDGYRQNSRMHRLYLQASDTYRYASNSELKATALYADLDYQTPGGLTYNQMMADPRSARLPTATLPGAVDQHIGINTKLLWGGLVNDAALSNRIRNVLAVYGNHVDFANPFITNYEQRAENTLGVRSYFTLSAIAKENFDWKLNLGLEWQQTNSQISNYDNNGGEKGAVQKIDKINTGQHFFFARYAADIFKRLHAEATASINYYGYKFRNLQPLNETDFTNRNFNAVLMPRIALSYELTNNFIWRASVSRGYSTPTTAEVRPTDNIINTALQAQTGWNYETGFRLRNFDESMILDASVFYYKLHNAIVRQLNPNETEYYINAGGTNQPGFELAFTDWLIRRKNNGFLRGLQVNTAVTISRFTFGNYQAAGNNYSGNRLTGVPREAIVSSVQALLPYQLAAFVQHNYTSGIPLNDANSVYAQKYHLLQARVSWQTRLSPTIGLELYTGADNLLNQRYSLGNDLNAVGNRYFNPAPPRNYFFGASLRI
ncbi:TonB-dependent receptor [Mucilaginibacter sp. 44-25]|uniref:TonB-dependent receptor n=1 Tax=Mucilaginibacter sp. 44-25 TaxID=1895794 RepID=UPI000AFF52D2|nr:TonB-dependent receptor [Mucilaginibacter sp. 44-25]